MFRESRLQATRSIYDERGFLVEEQALLDGTYITRVKTEYNALGEPISIIDAEGEQTLFFYDIITDETGQNVSRKTIIDSIGASTEILFDAFDRVVSLTKTSRQGELLSQQICAYDPVGNKVSEQNRNFLPSGAQETQTTRWVMGPMQQLKELHEGVGTDQERITHYTYGEDGKLASKLLPGMKTPILYIYNAQGRLYKISQKEGPEHLHLSNTYTYDSRGNITTAHSLHGKVVSREYNAFNEITAETIRENQFVYSILYNYDRKGRVTSIQLPDKSAIHYTYDALHGKNVSRKSSNEELLYTHAYTQFDTWGRLKQEEKPFQLGPQKREFNSRSQPTLTENNFYQENIGYGLLGNLLYIHRSGGFSNLSYTYNSLSQLIAEQGKIDITYTYDSLGNRLTKNEELYTYGTCNQLLSTPEDLYQYNPQGHITQRQRNQQTWTFENNALGQLILLHKDDKTELEFSYDPFGRRLSKKHFDVSTKYRKKISISHYLYIGDREVGILDDNKKILELQVPGISDESIAFELQGKTLIPLYDVRGNVFALVDPIQKKIVESYAYSAFGEEKIFDASHQQIETSTYSNSWRYGGQRQDAETNLLLIGLRYYDPQIGRWLSPDPALFIDGPNLYAYTQNNPLHYLDRHGLSSEDRYDEGWNDYLFGEVENHCFCERHRTCKRGGDLDKNYTYGPEVACIKFLDHFECSEKNKSRRYDLSSESEFQTLSRGMIIFINGINTTFEEAQDNSRHLGRLAGGYNIHGIYNATHGWLTDFYEYFLNRNLCATPPVRHLHLQWNQFFAQANSDTPLLVVCHSQGAVLLRNALMCYPKELRDRIIVVAVAPGVYIEDNLCRQVTHYVAEWDRDIVPWLNPTGRFHNRENVVVLKSDKDAPWFDHGFQSPTYNRSISDDLQKYVKRYGF